MCRPVAVEPVKLIRSTSWIRDQLLAPLVRVRGDHVEDAGRDVGVLGHELAEGDRAPRRRRRRFEHHRVAGCERGHHLGQVHLRRLVPRCDRGDDPDRLALRPPVRELADRVGDAEVLREFVAFEEIRHPADPGHGRVEPDGVAEHGGEPDLGDGHRLERRRVLLERSLQVAQGAHPQGDVAAPRGLVEGPPGRRDGVADVACRRVGSITEYTFSGGVQVGVRGGALGVDQLPVDEEAGLDQCCIRHGGELRARGTCIQDTSAVVCRRREAPPQGGHRGGNTDEKSDLRGRRGLHGPGGLAAGDDRRGQRPGRQSDGDHRE